MLVAIGSVAVGTLLSAVTEKWLEQTPTVLFTASVVFTAWFAGLRPALLSALLAAIARHFIFFPGPFQVPDVVHVIVFLFLALLIGKLFEQVQEEREWFRTTLMSIGDGVITTDSEGRIMALNPAAETLTGWKTKDARGLSLETVLKIAHEDTDQPVENPVKRALEERTIVSLENHTILHTKDGRCIPIEDSAAPIVDNRKQLIGAVMVFYDVTERRRAQKELEKAQRELSRHASELETRVAERTTQLQQSVQSLESVLYNIAHDLRAPLRAMRGFITALTDDYGNRLEKEGHDYCLRISNAADHMDRLILDLLDYGRLTHVDVPIRDIALSPLVDRVLETFADTVAQSKAIIEIHRPLPAVRGNEGVIEAVMANLLSNALKFVLPGTPPKVVIRAEQRDNFIRLWVEDSGIGIDPNYHHKIFQPFERLHGREEYTGTGVGLAIVRKGVERMGGSCGVESSSGQGSRFWLELPKA